MKKVYLAGPDVFYPDSQSRLARLESLCGARGLQGLAPSDAGIEEMLRRGTPRREIAKRIFEANVAHIRNCNAVIANMAPFRGDLEPDSGTVFEVGMAVGLGKPVAVYLQEGLTDWGSRIRDICGESENGLDARYGAKIEDFGLALNLMIACSSQVFTSPEAALDYLKQITI